MGLEARALTGAMTHESSRATDADVLATSGPRPASATDDAPLSPLERVLVAALVSAIVKEIRAEHGTPVQQPAA